MFKNMLVMGLTPLSSINNEVDRWENKPFSTIWPETEEKPKGPGITRIIKNKKTKRVRTAFTTDQLRALEKTFTRFKYLDSERRRELAATLNISEKIIKVWFQNRRMKEKREWSESSSDSSSETLNVPPSSSSMVDQVESTSFYHGNVNEGLNISTVRCSNNQNFGQSYPPVEYQTQAYQMPAFTGTSFVCDTNVYPAQYYPYPNDNYTGYSSNAHQYHQNYSGQCYENWLENFDVGY